MAKQLHIAITINGAEHGYDTTEDLAEAMHSVYLWVNRGRSGSKTFGVYSEDNRRVGRIEAKFVEVSK